MLRARPDKALEVYIDDRLIGWLTGPHCDFQHRVLVLEKGDDPVWVKEGELSPLPTIEQRVFKTEYRCWRLDDYKIASLQREHLEHLIATTVPAYAERHQAPHMRGYKYTWSSLEISQDDHEWLFDYRFFEPIDTKVDHDTFIERRLPLYGSAA